MPISNNLVSVAKKGFRYQNCQKTIDNNEERTEKNLLKIGSALPNKNKRSFCIRSHSTLNASVIHDTAAFCRSVTLLTQPDGLYHVSRVQEEKDIHPDRISLDRRGLVSIPIIDGEPKLRLLSLQHNLITNLEMIAKQCFPNLLFLDVYDNQLEQIQYLDDLVNLRVLLMGKNRIKKIEGLENLTNIEVLDLHGNLITQVTGLSKLANLKVLNLAGNQIKIIGVKDLEGLHSLQELNLRRNRLKKLLGFAEVPNLVKLFVSNNEIQFIEDMSSLAKSTNIKEISIDNNPVLLRGDCMSFLVSYLPLLNKINSMQITDQVRKAAMAWRRNKEVSSSMFMNLTNDVSLTCRRDEVISNARTNWEFLRSQTKCLTTNGNVVERSLNNLKPDLDFIMTPLNKTSNKCLGKIPLLQETKLNISRSLSQDTETSQNTISSNEFFKLPPILVPVIDKIEEKLTIDSYGSSGTSSNDLTEQTNSFVSKEESESDGESDFDVELVKDEIIKQIPLGLPPTPSELTDESIAKNSKDFVITNLPTEITTSSDTTNSSSETKITTRNVRSAGHSKIISTKHFCRASTAKAKKQTSPAVPKDREQGGDYLIEICGRHLNVYGQGALRFIDKIWNNNKANDVTTIRFCYVNFNSITGILNKVKHRFPNIGHFVFKETNLTYLGQINAFAEIQGLSSLYIDSEGNPIGGKNWKNYAIFRLAHWGLRMINNKEVSEQDIKVANEEYQGLSDLVLWSLPGCLLQPLLVRMRIDISNNAAGEDAKNWLLTADIDLKTVISKEALQWKKPSQIQEENSMRTKAKQNILNLLDEMKNSMYKLMLLDEEWPNILHGFVQSTLLDYSQIDLYMKKQMQELTR
ncbi:leucine-rich repeat-containing protein 49 isoform X1 [Diorhabda carinulata]|uniref:leucine-rich repeat-containing protein 49 isoform X1 n=1 Tax=Diorhabda carinulata TaxID=1163345 RepID=UPI0025A202D0|nr:leucine-rich repeat-containing protein 49 isoform X1 [Diorhabda carinulata]